MPDRVETEYVIIKTAEENKFEILTREPLPEAFDLELTELVKKYAVK